MNQSGIPAEEHELLESVAKTEDLSARAMRSLANLIPIPTVKTMLN